MKVLVNQIEMPYLFSTEKPWECENLVASACSNTRLEREGHLVICESESFIIFLLELVISHIMSSCH